MPACGCTNSIGAAEDEHAYQNPESAHFAPGIPAAVGAERAGSEPGSFPGFQRHYCYFAMPRRPPNARGGAQFTSGRLGVYRQLKWRSDKMKSSRGIRIRLKGLQDGGLPMLGHPLRRRQRETLRCKLQ